SASPTGTSSASGTSLPAYVRGFASRWWIKSVTLPPIKLLLVSSPAPLEHRELSRRLKLGGGCIVAVGSCCLRIGPSHATLQSLIYQRLAFDCTQSQYAKCVEQGHVVSPQRRLAHATKKNNRALYAALCFAGGAREPIVSCGATAIAFGHCRTAA